MENSQLTIADLASIHNIIDAACSRGAFKAAEMKQVGYLYEKLTAFLETVKAQAEAERANVPAETQPQGE